MNHFAKSTNTGYDIYIEIIDWHWDIFFDLVNLKGYDKHVLCPKCLNVTKYYFKNIHGVLKCPPPCQKTYSPTFDTIFSNSKLYLPFWLYAIYLIKTYPEIKLCEIQIRLNCTNVTACNVRKKIKTLTNKSIEMILYEKHYTRILYSFSPKSLLYIFTPPAFYQVSQ